MNQQDTQHIEKINSILKGMTADQRRDWYYLAMQAFDGKPEAAARVRETFGDASIFTCHVIVTACYKALTPSERRAVEISAQRELIRVNAVPPADAEAYQKRRNDEVCPLLALRTARGMTQAELSQKSGINIRQLRRFETGEAKIDNISAANLVALADALGVDVHELIGTTNAQT